MIIETDFKLPNSQTRRARRDMSPHLTLLTSAIRRRLEIPTAWCGQPLMPTLLCVYQTFSQFPRNKFTSEVEYLLLPTMHSGYFASTHIRIKCSLHNVQVHVAARVKISAIVRIQHLKLTYNLWPT